MGKLIFGLLALGGIGFVLSQKKTIPDNNIRPATTTTTQSPPTTTTTQSNGVNSRLGPFVYVPEGGPLNYTPPPYTGKKEPVWDAVNQIWWK